jgi:glycosyltransferase involved in cell wall biosynthesis
MRIAFLITSLGIGGAERQVIALAERMAARGHAVLIVVLLPRTHDQWSTSVDVLHLDLQKADFFGTIRAAIAAVMRAAKILRSFRPDILHCHNFHGNLLGRALKPLVPGMCVISTIHNVYEGGRMRMSAYRLTDPWSDRTIAVCAAAAHRMIEIGAVPPRKCSVIANGIDAAQFTPDPERRQRMRGQMGVKDQFVWMAAGRVTPAKDYENLLRAFANLHSAEPNAQLWIAGEGSGDYAQRMQSLTRELGLQTSVRWLGLQRDIAALLDAADGFVLASAWEGMPLALGEAMVMQKPTVATGVGGVREMMGECGTVVPASDCAALSFAMLNTTRATTADREHMGTAARQRILERFSMDGQADLWEAAYSSAGPKRAQKQFAMQLR